MTSLMSRRVTEEKSNTSSSPAAKGRKAAPSSLARSTKVKGKDKGPPRAVRPHLVHSGRTPAHR